MKRFITCCALLGLVVLTACSGDSPSQRPLPTPAPDTWAIPSLTVDPTNPYVRVGVYVTATVTKNGSSAPNGTAVEFIATAPGLVGFYFPAYSSSTATVATVNGAATILFYAENAGAYAIQARVVDAVQQISVTYREPSTSDVLQITSIEPAVGSRLGGEQVVITGVAIIPPIEVSFRVAGRTYQADIVDWHASEPLSDPGTITVRTPQIVDILGDPCHEYWADVRVTVGVGTGRDQSTEVTGGFLFLVEDATCQPTPDCPTAPEVYLVVPDHGTSAGGEQVTVLGRYFGMYWDAGAQAFRYQATESVQVDFITPTRTLRGIDPVVSPDGHQITVTTPRYGSQPLTDDVIASVKVTSLVSRDPVACGTGELSDTKTEAFVFNADQPTPQILAVAPTAGPIDGGTVVTIFGHGFQFPVQVMFGNLEAVVNEVNDDTSAADNDTIICVTPNYSTQGQTPPVAVDVKVTNVHTGLNDTLAGAFTYGANLFISGNSPTRGGRGTVVTIYGNGFSDPLQVDFLGGGTIRLETVAVSGTEVIARFPDDETPECQDSNGQFRITMPELPPGQGVVEGGSFTYLGLNPVVISVVPSIVQETLGGAGVTPPDVVIHGQRFTAQALVRVDGYTIPSQYVDVVSDTEIDISQLPAPNDFNLNWNTSPCVTPQGQDGTRRVATPVEVTVTNIPGECADTLTGGLVYEPQTSECTVGAQIDVQPSSPINFGQVPHGSCSIPPIGNPITVTITANSAADLEIQTMNLVGRFFFWDGGLAGQSLGARTVPAFGTTTVDIVFCPDVNNNLDYNGVFVIRSNGVPDPFQIDLQGTEMGVDINGPTTLAVPVAPGVVYTVTNLGDSLDWTAELTTGTSFTVSPASGYASGLNDWTFTVTLTGAPGDTDVLTITATDPDNPGETDTVVVDLTGI